MRAWGLGALSLLALVGCEDASARRITADDITTIGPGTAVGSLFSGDYVITSGAIEGCNCRVSSCATIHVLVGNVLTVAQTDGTLQISQLTSSLVLSGGVESDGSFRVNASVVQPGDVEFALADGQFVFDSTSVTSFRMNQEVTASVVGQLDCDIKGWASAQYAGPPTASAGTDRGAGARVPGSLAFGVGP